MVPFANYYLELELINKILFFLKCIQNIVFFEIREIFDKLFSISTREGYMELVLKDSSSADFMYLY